MRGVSSEIQAKAMAGEFEAARLLVHKVKGSAGNLGAVDLYGIAMQLENEIKKERFDDSTFAAFEDQLNKTMAVIEGQL
jgi:HPt (histidine-containing phosphotransfer) domain-containing protein